MDISVCPDCGGILIVRDSRNRKVKDSSGTVSIFRLRRLECPKCKKIHTELPDCVGLYIGLNRGSSIKFNFAEGCYHTDSKTLIEKPFVGKYSASVEFELELATLDMSQGE